MALKAVLFDMGDTLIDGWRDEELDAICKRVGEIHPDYRDVLRVAAQRFAEQRQKDLVTFEQYTFEDIYRRTLTGMLSLHAAASGLKISDTIFTRVAALTEAVAGAYDVLDELRGQYKLAIVSNVSFRSYRYNLLLVRKELAHYFDVVVFSSQLGIRKPHPRIFQYALDCLGVSPEEAIHVGDKIERDVLGAHRAGIKAVWFNREGRRRKRGEERPDWTIRELTELPSLLRRFDKGGA